MKSSRATLAFYQAIFSSLTLSCLQRVLQSIILSHKTLVYTTGFWWIKNSKHMLIKKVSLCIIFTYLLDKILLYWWLIYLKIQNCPDESSAEQWEFSHKRALPQISSLLVSTTVMSLKAALHLVIQFVLASDIAGAQMEAWLQYIQNWARECLDKTTNNLISIVPSRGHFRVQNNSQRPLLLTALTWIYILTQTVEMA